MKNSGFKPDLYIVYRILKILSREAMTKTALATHARLNYQRAVRYFDYLIEAGLVEIRGNKLQLTERGFKTLEKIEQIFDELLKGG